MAVGDLRQRAWIVLAAALLGAAVTARLGVWQLSRASQKEAMQAALDSRASMPPLDGASLASRADEALAQHYRHVVLRGRWVADRTVFLDNRQMGGRTGFYVVTPLLLEHEGAAVLVQRGWAPRDMVDRTRVPVVTSTPGVVEVAGLVAPPPGRLYELSDETAGPIRQNLDLDAFARETGLRLRPVSVLQSDSPSSVGDGLARQWPRPAVDVHKNYGYAFQWFALAALITGLYVWFQLVRPRLQRRA